MGEGVSEEKTFAMIEAFYYNKLRNCVKNGYKEGEESSMKMLRKLHKKREGIRQKMPSKSLAYLTVK